MAGIFCFIDREVQNFLIIVIIKSNDSMTLRTIIITTVMLMTTLSLSAQSAFGHSLHSPYAIGEYYVHEFGGGYDLVRINGEQTWTTGAHAHYAYMMGGGRYGVGAGFEMIFDEHKHKTIGAVIAYRPLYPMTVLLLTGATWDNIPFSEVRLAVQGEILYEWAWRNLHFGPSLRYSYDPDDTRYSLGVHIGAGF